MNRHLIPFKHRAHVLRHLRQHLLEGKDKRILVTVTEGAAIGHDIHEMALPHLSVGLCHSRMMLIERHKPIAQFVEEGEALHL